MSSVIELRELSDPALITRWSLLRMKVALYGRSVPADLKREYAAVSAEYRRRIEGRS